MTDELMNSLNRKPGRPPKSDPEAPNDTGVPPAVEESELEKLRQQNADLMKIVLEMQAKLMPEAVKPENRRPMLDKKRPFAKHRSMDSGITYEQDGKKFNGKFELIEE